MPAGKDPTEWNDSRHIACELEYLILGSSQLSTNLHVSSYDCELAWGIPHHPVCTVRYFSSQSTDGGQLIRTLSSIEPSPEFPPIAKDLCSTPEIKKKG